VLPVEDKGKGRLDGLTDADLSSAALISDSVPKTVHGIAVYVDQTFGFADAAAFCKMGK